jgi:CRISPR-associated protein Cas6
LVINFLNVEEDMEQNNPFINLHFQVIGKQVKVDHGFALHSAIGRVLTCFHDDEHTGVRLLRGRYVGDGLLDISPWAALIFRLQMSRISLYIPLAGKTLEVKGERLRVGVPKTSMLVPSVALYSHLVTTKNGQDEIRFREEIGRQMETLGVKGKFSVGNRRTFQVHGKQVVGYSMLVDELTAEESVTLQERGLGGRRKMGCGFFEPWKG